MLSLNLVLENLQLVLSKTNRIGDTKYIICCSTPLPCRNDLAIGKKSSGLCHDKS